MFKLSDRVRHVKTGDIGVVVGYGYCPVNYKTIIKVSITQSTLSTGIVEDLFSEWLFYCPEPTPSHFFAAA